MIQVERRTCHLCGKTFSGDAHVPLLLDGHEVVTKIICVPCVESKRFVYAIGTQLKVNVPVEKQSTFLEEKG